MAVKIVLAALVGALSGMLAATGGVLWPPRPAGALSTAATVARIESAWNTARHLHAP